MTDGAAIMARMAGSSVSWRIVSLDERWMSCFVHALSNSVKVAMVACAADPVLVKVSGDFKAMKRIVKDSKRHCWNYQLASGYHLKQDVQTRFETNYLVTERFLKSSGKVWDVIVSQNRIAARSAFESITKQTSSETGFILGYETLEAAVDAFKPVYEATMEFQMPSEPMLHKVLPSLQHFLRSLDHI